MAYPIIQQFSLPNTRASMIASLREILEFIKVNLPGFTTGKELDFKIEMVVTELLTNAFKHAGDTEITISITIDQQSLVIEKKDYGHPFNPQNLVSLPVGAGHKIQLSKDDLYCLYAFIGKNSQVTFICEENNAAAGFVDIMEHFGLLIITKLASRFTYRYDQASGLNTFYVRMPLS